MENSKLSDVKGKELVAAGHAFAKAIGMDTPLIEIAKMMAELATRLDCALVRGDELEKQRDALAAENAALKSCAEFYAASFMPISIKNGPSHMPTNALLNDAGAVARRAKETLATDAYLNSVRAEAVESFAHQQRVIADALLGHESQRSHRITASRAEDFAKQLRAGKDGE